METVKILPYEQRYHYADCELPTVDRQQNMALLYGGQRFLARTPVGIREVFIGKDGCLWYFGDGQEQILRRNEHGREPDWIAVNALPQEKLRVLSLYRARNLRAAVLYIEALYKNMEADLQLDQVMASSLDEHLQELLTDVFWYIDFLRKNIIRGYTMIHAAEYTLRTYEIQRRLYRECLEREQREQQEFQAAQKLLQLTGEIVHEQKV